MCSIYLWKPIRYFLVFDYKILDWFNPIPMKLFLLPCLAFSLFSICSAQSSLRQQIDAWCDTHFDRCFPGREFVQTTRITRDANYTNDNGTPYRYISGKIQYNNLLGIPNTVGFKMFVYSNRIYFQKETWDYNTQSEQWEWMWEECSRSTR